MAVLARLLFVNRHIVFYPWAGQPNLGKSEPAYFIVGMREHTKHSLYALESGIALRVKEAVELDEQRRMCGSFFVLIFRQCVTV